MKRPLIRSNTFVKAAKRVIKKQPQLAPDLKIRLELLAEDAFHPKLKTHKLKGKLSGSWACSAGYDLRILFDFVQYHQQEAILLQTIGTHDQVY